MTGSEAKTPRSLRRVRVLVWAALDFCILEGRPVTVLEQDYLKRQGELWPTLGKENEPKRAYQRRWSTVR